MENSDLCPQRPLEAPLLPGSLFEEHWFLRCEVFCLVAPVPVHAVWRGQCWPLQCLMCRLSALSSAGMEPAVSAFVSASVQPSAGAAVSDSKDNTTYSALKAGQPF